MIAGSLIGPELRAKVGASDLVQETFVEAQQHLPVLRGKTDSEMRAWLRRILECRLSNIRRAYLVTEKRAAKREVALGSDACDLVVGLAALPGNCPSPSNHAMQNE